MSTFAIGQTALSDTVRSAPSPLSQGPTIIMCPAVAMISGGRNVRYWPIADIGCRPAVTDAFDDGAAWGLLRLCIRAVRCTGLLARA